MHMPLQTHRALAWEAPSALRPHHHRTNLLASKMWRQANQREMDALIYWCGYRSDESEGVVVKVNRRQSIVQTWWRYHCDKVILQAHTSRNKSPSSCVALHHIRAYLTCTQTSNAGMQLKQWAVEGMGLVYHVGWISCAIHQVTRYFHQGNDTWLGRPPN